MLALTAGGLEWQGSTAQSWARGRSRGELRPGLWGSSLPLGRRLPTRSSLGGFCSHVVGLQPHVPSVRWARFRNWPRGPGQWRPCGPSSVGAKTRGLGVTLVLCRLPVGASSPFCSLRLLPDPGPAPRPEGLPSGPAPLSASGSAPFPRAPVPWPRPSGAACRTVSGPPPLPVSLCLCAEPPRLAECEKRPGRGNEELLLSDVPGPELPGPAFSKPPASHHCTNARPAPGHTLRSPTERGCVPVAPGGPLRADSAAFGGIHRQQLPHSITPTHPTSFKNSLFLKTIKAKRYPEINSLHSSVLQ